MPLQIRVPEDPAATPEDLYENFAVDRPGKIVFVGRRLSVSNSVRCVIRKLSQYGAQLEVSPKVELPSHFFLEILGIRDEIGCTVTRREGEIVTVGFNMLIDPEFLHHVRRLSFES
ncbi:hypothetical protein NOF55_18830 [Rhizobiaceae bacterium BDR2-2]|uniref:PilZ domain-containing protein n=1 Tax=Ectorhizobium quercum TaxID=2965071 RepID=A0AAE3N1Q4_9HYPH|nr:hypothetical protein [Ectorhizobium quercum]MCX8999163.1 hypothetical protein [Ectorhizobium quercum]